MQATHARRSSNSVGSAAFNSGRPGCAAYETTHVRDFMQTGNLSMAHVCEAVAAAVLFQSDRSTATGNLPTKCSIIIYGFLTDQARVLYRRGKENGSREQWWPCVWMAIRHATRIESTRFLTSRAAPLAAAAGLAGELSTAGDPAGRQAGRQGFSYTTSPIPSLELRGEVLAHFKRIADGERPCREEVVVVVRGRIRQRPARTRM